MCIQQKFAYITHAYTIEICINHAYTTEINHSCTYTKIYINHTCINHPSTLPLDFARHRTVLNQEAWEKIFPIQNSQMKHSWFIRFTYQFEKPNWFTLTFWKKFEPIKEILPKQICGSIKKGSELLQLFENYGVPWIMRWTWGKTTQSFPDYYLHRCISVKW